MILSLFINLFAMPAPKQKIATLSPAPQGITLEFQTPEKEKGLKDELLAAQTTALVAADVAKDLVEHFGAEKAITKQLFTDAKNRQTIASEQQQAVQLILEKGEAKIGDGFTDLWTKVEKELTEKAKEDKQGIEAAYKEIQIPVDQLK